MSVTSTGASLNITVYWLDGLGIEPRWNFPYPFRSAQRPTQPPAQWVPGLFSGGKAAGRGDDLPPPTIAGVEYG